MWGGPRWGWAGCPDTQPLTIHLLPFAVARRPGPRPRAKSAGAGSETAREGPRGSDPWPTQPVGQCPAPTPGGRGPPAKRLCPGFPHVLGSVNKADGLPSQVCAGSQTRGSGGHGLEERLSGWATVDRSAGRGPKGHWGLPLGVRAHGFRGLGRPARLCQRLPHLPAPQPTRPSDPQICTSAKVFAPPPHCPRVVPQCLSAVCSQFGAEELCLWSGLGGGEWEHTRSAYRRALEMWGQKQGPEQGGAHSLRGLSPPEERSRKARVQRQTRQTQTALSVL